MSILRSLLSAAAAYVPTEWVTGDVITAEKLNHMEDGIADATEVKMIVPIFTDNGTNITCDKTFDEVLQAVINGTCTYAKYINTNGPSDEYNIVHPQHYLTYMDPSIIDFQFTSYAANTQTHTLTSILYQTIRMESSGVISTVGYSKIFT